MRRVIDRATFGWTPALDLEARTMGLDAWLDQQLDPVGPATPALDAMLAPATGSASSNPDGYLFLEGTNLENHPWTDAATFTQAAARETRARYEVRHATLLRAVHSRRQLYEVMVDFWSNHFNVYNDGSFYQRHLKCANDRTVARAHALGRFSDLLQASTHDTQMLLYLDNWRSEADPSAGPDDPPGVNENYGRELIELHTLGIIDGEQVYSEADVVAAAKILSGWSIDLAANAPFETPGEWGFVYRHASHWRHGASFLGGEFVHPADLGSAAAYQSGVDFVDFLAHHPSTARFLAYKLCKRFVADAPPMDLVDDLAAVYLANDTAIGPVLRALLTSQHVLDAPLRVRRGFEAIVFQLRATGAKIDPRPRGDSFAGAATYLSDPSTGVLAGVGQHLFGRPSPDGYPEATSEWLSSVGMLRRWTFAGALASNTANQGIDVPTKVLTPLGGTSAVTPSQLVDKVATRLLGPLAPLAASGFTDVSPTHPFAVDIAWMKAAGITTGNTYGTYKPGSSVSRQAMAAFLHRLVDPGGTFEPPASPSFSDVAPTSPFYADVEWMKAEGISTGTPGSPKPAYKPADPVSRQAMSAFLHRLADPDGTFEPPGEPTFPDVPTTNPFFLDVEWMAWAGISTGNADGTFAPVSAVSRQAMAAFLHRFAPEDGSMLPPEERAAILDAVGGTDLPIDPIDAEALRIDVLALVLSSPTAVRR